MEREAQSYSGQLATLGLLPDPGWRLRPFIESFALNVAIAILLIFFTLARLHRASIAPRYQETVLTFPAMRPPVPSPPRIKLPPPPPRTQLARKVDTPRIATPKPEPPQPQPEMVRLKPATAPILPPAPAKAVAALAQPKVGLFASPKVTTTSTHRNLSSIRSGGFGDPVGVTANPNASQHPTLPAVGSFNDTPGTEAGSGHVGQGHFGQGTVASAGFANGVTVAGPGSGEGSGLGRVATGGFGGNVIGVGAPPKTLAQAPSFTPPQVLAEPRPQYTQEARQLKIQGEITLQVCFGTDGRVQVLRVVSGLGHGLDGAARLAAEQIRFKPAMKDGQPTNHTTLIHILFQLA